MLSIKEGISSISQVLKSDQITNIALKMLACINKEVTLHSIRTAYLALETARQHPMNEKCSLRNLVFLSLFHTIGFYREDFYFNYNPHDYNLSFFSDKKDITSKYVFACYYLEFMTPIKKDALCLENFNEPYDNDMTQYLYQEEYKTIIYMCARISDYVNKKKKHSLPKDINRIAPGYFDPEYVKAFKKANENNRLLVAIENGTFEEELSKFIATISFDDDENKMLSKMLVHLLDFKSTVTMQHSINTSGYAVSLGLRAGLDSKQLSILFTSAFLHDIGKIATPQRILEFPGKLSPEDMGIMRHHVNHSKRILNGYVPQEILDTVYRHHEKLNGKGYPRHIGAAELTLIQRILTVADITSALIDSRSYKAEFSKKKTISILQEMTENGELDASITRFVLEELDMLLKEQKKLHKLLSVDFSRVILSYNDYIINDATPIADSAIYDEDIDDIEELEEI